MKKNGNKIAGIILGGLSVIGLVATTVLTVKATVKAVDILKKAEEEKMEPLTTFEKVQVAGPVYIPAVATGLATSACIIGGTILTVSTIAKLAASYALLDQTFQQYRNHVNVLYGEDADLKVQQDISLSNGKVFGYLPLDGAVENSYKEKFLLHEPISDLWFDTTLVELRTAQLEFNRKFQIYGNGSINEFLNFLGQPPIPNGGNIGWTVDMIQFAGYAFIDIYEKVVTVDDPDSPDYVELFYPLPPISDISEWDVYLEDDRQDELDDVPINYTYKTA